jgi:hypothetical protein
MIVNVSTVIMMAHVLTMIATVNVASLLKINYVHSTATVVGIQEQN